MCLCLWNTERSGLEDDIGTLEGIRAIDSWQSKHKVFLECEVHETKLFGGGRSGAETLAIFRFPLLLHNLVLGSLLSSNLLCIAFSDHGNHISHHAPPHHLRLPHNSSLLPPLLPLHNRQPKPRLRPRCSHGHRTLIIQYIFPTLYSLELHLSPLPLTQLFPPNRPYTYPLTTSQPPAPTTLSTPSPALAIASLSFAILGCADLTATNLDEQVSSFYWSSQAPVRLAFFLGITGYSYMWKPAGGVLSEIGGARVGVGKQGSFLGGMLCNSVVFTWAFVEMLMWFWVSDCCSYFCYSSNLG